MSQAMLPHSSKNQAGNGFEWETGTEKSTLSQTLMDLTLSACISPGQDKNLMAQSVIELLGELHPDNALEGMLATQMVAAHFQAMAQLRSAAMSTNANAQQQHLQLGTKLQRIFLSQAEVLMKLRGVQQQKVLVEHVHVHEGGQAIVGQIYSGRGEVQG